MLLCNDCYDDTLAKLERAPPPPPAPASSVGGAASDVGDQGKNDDEPEVSAGQREAQKECWYPQGGRSQRAEDLLTGTYRKMRTFTSDWESQGE